MFELPVGDLYSAARVNQSGDTSLVSRALDVFRAEGRWCWPAVVAFAFINLVVLWNAIVHDPRFGYDAPGHIAYVRTLADGRLPTPADTHEFFSPPLPYAPAAIAWRIFDGSASEGRQIAALKVAQIVQCFASILTCWSVLAIAKLIRDDRWMLLSALVAMGIVPAYYRTFAMVRGEPIMVALLLLGAVWTFRTFTSTHPTFRGALVAGLLLGGAVLSRQWAFFALPALALVGLWQLVVDAPSRKQTLASGIVLLAAAALVGGWYYVHLHREHGSIRAFNRPPEEIETAEPAPRPAGSLVRSMARAPVRHAFDTHPAWLFYADTWGDYWRYFLISARDQKGRLVKAVQVERLVRSGKASSSNSATMPAYLGRVCVVSVVPSAILIGGIAYGVWQVRRWPRQPADASRLVVPVVSLAILSTMGGYAWFVASYPNDHLDTVKASYPLQVFPFLAIVTAAMWCAVRDNFPRAARSVEIVLVLIFVHNLPTLFTRYGLW